MSSLHGRRSGPRPALGGTFEEAAENALGQEDDEQHQEQPIDQVVPAHRLGAEADAQHLGQQDGDDGANGWAWQHVDAADDGGEVEHEGGARVAEEALETLAALGIPAERMADVGVAGIHRLLAKTNALRDARAVIVVAGMDGALPSVVGGLVRGPVIAVPTRVGYGASFGGLAALLTMLNSCAAGVVVCNIDNGFGAAMAAARAIGA